MPRKTENKAADNTPGRFAYDGLDRVLHERARLGILSSLAVHEGGLLFADLKQLCGLTDGNLNRHLAVLSEAGLVGTWKGQQGPRPQTLYRLTPEGRDRFAAYLGELERVVADAQARLQPDETESTAPVRWSPT